MRTPERTPNVTVDLRSGIERLDRDECLRLLGDDVIGRLAVLDGHRPAIFPVNYVLDGEDIVFRTDPGTKLSAQSRAPACFEIDDVDRATHAGWSVVASGHLEEVTRYSSSTLQRLRDLPLEPWATGAKAHWMRLVTGQITGRRIGTPRA